MRNLILAFFSILFISNLYSQTITPVKVYVKNSNGYEYGVTVSWSDSSVRLKYGTVVSIESVSPMYDAWTLNVVDCNESTLLTACVFSTCKDSCCFFETKCSSPTPFKGNMEFMFDLSNSVGISDIVKSRKKVVKVYDSMGIECDVVPNKILIFKYEDGSTRKTMIIQ